MYMKGYFPEFEVDHINGNKSDNRWRNLRHVTHACNMQNQKMYSTNTSGFTGVSYRKRSGKWEAGIMVRQKIIYLGAHDDVISAALARVIFENQCDQWTCNEQDHNRIKLREWGYRV